MPVQMDFDVLPLEVLQDICGRLIPRDLRNASFASRRLRQGSVPHLFSRVVVRVSEGQDFASHVQDLENLLTRLGSTGHVRQIPLCDRHDRAERTSRESGPDRENHWCSFVRLLPRLSALQRLIYGCAELPPPCLLDVLEASLPNCGLHMQTFRLEHSKSTERSRLTSHGRRILKSPSLHGITMSHQWLHPEGLLDDRNELLFDLLGSSLAPNLREITIRTEPTDWSSSSYSAQHLQLMEWKDTELGPFSHARFRQKITSLQLYGDRPLELLKGALTGRMLMLSMMFSQKMMFSRLRGFSGGPRFENLRRLCMFLNPYPAPEGHPTLVSMTETFLESLPPLRDLELDGFLTQGLLNVILTHQGRSVRRLVLPWIYDNPHPRMNSYSLASVQQVRSCCPSLEELSLPIQRSGGDDREKTIYQVFGSFTSLQRLTLRLDCAISNPHLERSASVSNPDHLQIRARIHSGMFYLDQDIPIRLSDLTEILKNCAIDEQLARDIYSNILRGSKPGHFPLERLEIHGERAGYVYGIGTISNLKRVAIELSRSWLCTLNFGDFANPRIEPLGEAEREDLERSFDKRGGIAPSAKVMAAFMQLWPCEERDWRSRWHSFPLGSSPDRGH